MSTKRHLVGRRQFLASSAWAIAAAAVAPRRLLAGASDAPPKRLAVGYAPLDDAAAVVPASRIPAGDGAFIGHGARISVSGASGLPADPQSRRVTDFLVNYSYLDGAERREAPFRAWACSRRTGCQGAPVSFTVPVDEVQTISISVAVENGGRKAASPISRRELATTAAAGDDAVPVKLTLLSGADTIKLVRGYYVIVPLYDNDGEPPWLRYELKSAGGRWALHGSDGAVVPFEHFVLRVNYAK